jgi:hypothetical protein
MSPNSDVLLYAANNPIESDLAIASDTLRYEFFCSQDGALTALKTAKHLKEVWMTRSSILGKALPPAAAYQSKHETYKRPTRKGRPMSQPKPKALPKLGQIAFNDKWSRATAGRALGAVASVRPQDGLWQVEVPGHAPMFGADLNLLDLCVQTIANA